MTDTNASSEYVDFVDGVTPQTLKQLTDLTEPCVSLLMPTQRDNPDVRHDALFLRSLVEEAADQLRERGVDPDSILAPVSGLVDDTPFWNRQGEGLAIYADSQGHHVFRLPRAVEPTAHVGDAPRLVPLVPVATGDESFHLLALSQNQVRLFAATRDSIREMDLGPVPGSIDDVEHARGREPELQHQHQPHGHGVATFHGHGGADDSDLAVDKFIAAVASGVRARLGAGSAQPLVLAAVAEHLPALESTGRLPMLVDEAVTGNPENLRPDELLERAWPIVRAQITRRREELTERFGAAHGTGTAVTDPVELRRAAEEGRVGTVLVAPPDRPSVGGNGADTREVARPDEGDDLAVAAALRTGADLAVADLPADAAIAAILRY